MRVALALILAAVAAPALGQEPTPPAWPYPTITTVAPNPEPLPAVPGIVYVPVPSGPIPTGLPERTIPADELPPPTNGQQHWVSANLGVFQPFAVRVGVKVLPRANNSVWVEGYWGSALFSIMYGAGVRIQHTAKTFRNGDRLMVSPGFGVHVIPDWRRTDETYQYDPYYGGGYYTTGYKRNALWYAFGDVDVSWLHDFGPHFGFELGVKLGLAGRVAGKVGRDYPSFVMFGKDFYPLFSVYAGFRI